MLIAFEGIWNLVLRPSQSHCSLAIVQRVSDVCQTTIRQKSRWRLATGMRTLKRRLQDMIKMPM